MVLADPDLVVAQVVEPLDELHVARERQRRVLADPVKRCQEDSEAHSLVGHSVSDPSTPAGGTGPVVLPCRPMIDQTIRVGFVGAGANTRRHHIPKLRAQPGVGLVSVANRTKESGERVAREFGIARVHADWREVVEARDVDAVCIGTWPYLHCEVTLAALARGKHVLCEARMAMDAAEGRRMLDAARKAPGLIAQLVPAPHTLELDGTLRALLAE